MQVRRYLDISVLNKDLDPDLCTRQIKLISVFTVPTVHMVTTAHHMELGMEMNWLRGFSVSLNTDTVSWQLLAVSCQLAADS